MSYSSLEKKQETVGEMARRDYRKAEVFKKLGIDFCCGGKKTVEEAAEAAGLDVNLVKEALDKSETVNVGTAQHDFDGWPSSFLADYIVNVHHKYVRESTQLLDELSNRVAYKHGERFTYLPLLRHYVMELLEELHTHMKKEEMILFPFIKQLEQKNAGTAGSCGSFSTVQQPISVMEDDHNAAGELVKKIKDLTSNFTIPANACNSHNLYFKKLEEFVGDLYQHIHLENNILFPKAVQMEKAQ
ncbi:iron-sulfur cluster repair di-iron protein [Pinibacter aurantiacus]|uniref:Iron-sulfur cluster repair di-iron protein n=1 Tax=Pinibacter aurantiacus TaxID=2851599 RepID=A0A9E2SDW1_9BACT|nr:iron-sulfur cluster repair di-iron protein [Pinibacter aurantiacus]MBV4359638.1 iron-sulfur cluster repair di-iron protein [Pinibacter aurantiacus]